MDEAHSGLGRGICSVFGIFRGADAFLMYRLRASPQTPGVYPPRMIR